MWRLTDMSGANIRNASHSPCAVPSQFPSWDSTRLPSPRANSTRPLTCWAPTLPLTSSVSRWARLRRLNLLLLARTTRQRIRLSSRTLGSRRPDRSAISFWQDWETRARTLTLDYMSILLNSGSGRGPSCQGLSQEAHGQGLEGLVLR